MENHIIRKEDGTIMKWDKSKNNNYFCLLYNDNKQKYYFTPTQDLKCSVFMIGGGGAGGYYFGGGGGAGSAYMNDNFIFKKNTSYSFEIGTGGKCDIDNINNLFQKGLNLKVFNNTTPKLDKISFSGDDYSSLGITSNNSNIIQSFITENITIPTTIFNNNTTYIWDGYIKPNNNFIRITVNSKIKIMIWVDKKVFDNSSTILNGINVNDVKVLQLDTNKYFNIKIIAYNFDTANTDFNIKFEDCDLFNFNKNGEVYNYTQATDTNIIYRTEDEKSFIIKSKGGGNGGCGYYNRNSNLDGGCGGGSGIDKKNGKAIIDPSFNGNDGAVGTYCGGGGGIISAGNNNYGGKGKIIDWFNDNLVFGAGGNGAGTKEDRKLGYGSGGNGAECCQFSKLNIDNDGNNGCVLIYLKPVITEKFTDSDTRINILSSKTTTYYDDNSIINKLLSESFSLFNNTDANSIACNIDRKMYFTSIGQTFANLCYNDNDLTITDNMTPPPLSLAGGDNNMNNFIYDMLVASKLFAVIYRLYYHQFKVICESDINNFDTFLSSANIKFTSDSNATAISGTTVNINKLFDIENLKLPDSNFNYKTDVYCASAYLNMDSNAYDKTLEDIGSNIEVPFYHYSNNNSNYSIPGLKKWYVDNYSTATKIFVNKIDPIVTGSSDSISITTYSNSNCASPLTSFGNLAADIDTSCSASSPVVIPLNYITSTYLTKDRLKEIYTSNKSLLNGADADKDNYSKQRILFHLENFNIILNTNVNIMLSTLKYYMYYYNAVVYNVILQYDLFKLQQLRITNFKGGIRSAYSNGTGGNLYKDSTKYDDVSSSAVYGYKPNIGLTTNNGDPNTYLTNTQTDIDKFGSNLVNIYSAINASTKYVKMVEKINSNTSDINSISSEFDKYQTNYNKVVNIYNNDLDNYKTINNYYRAIIVIAIVIIVIAIFIFSIPNIDGNAQTGILLITSVIMIIFYAFYLVNLKSTETFINCNYKNATDGINNYGANLDFSTYKQNLLTYNTFLMVMASGFSSTGDTLTPINDFVDQANLMRRRRILFYKTKIAEYTHASELLKKSADDYYYLMTLIYFSIIIALVAMAFYLLFPTMIFTVIIFAILIFLILLIFIVYRINRSTRLFNDKNYWANFNPTPEVIQSL